MPAFALADKPTTLRRFDVVGVYSETSPGFVGHVALFNSDDREVRCDEAVPVAHMVPPLITDKCLSADVAGSIPLSNNEIDRIGTWIDKVSDEYKREDAGKRQQYRIDPPWKDIRDKNTGVLRYRQYSCAGFVLDAHLQVDVWLLLIDREALPEVTRQTLETAYHDASRPPGLLAKFGLEGDGPWRVVLAGYVLHALDRSSDEIRAEPYLAQGGDEFF